MPHIEYKLDDIRIVDENGEAISFYQDGDLVVISDEELVKVIKRYLEKDKTRKLNLNYDEEK